MGKSTGGADRRQGGPGSSHQNPDKPRDAGTADRPEPGAPTNSDRSRVSGGGGERDRHHTHDPTTKS